MYDNVPENIITFLIVESSSKLSFEHNRIDAGTNQSDGSKLVNENGGPDTQVASRQTDFSFITTHMTTSTILINRFPYGRTAHSHWASPGRSRSYHLRATSRPVLR